MDVVVPLSVIRKSSMDANIASAKSVTSASNHGVLMGGGKAMTRAAVEASATATVERIVRRTLLGKAILRISPQSLRSPV